MQQRSMMGRSPSIARSPVRRPRIQRSMPRWCLFVCVLLPFAAAYCVSYVCWLIDPLIASSLTKDFNLSSGDLGLLGSSYFLALMVGQLPFGALIDRHGPRRVQSICLMFSAAGAVVYALADTLPVLILGRIMIGVGVSTILIAGLKSISNWFPTNQVATANGLLVSVGALGALTATEPASLLVEAFGWRLVYLSLAAATALCAVIIWVIVPEPGRQPLRRQDPLTLGAIFGHSGFWTVVPLSAACVGTAWAMQGLWAAQWMSEVEAFDQQTVIRHLFVMALALAFGATFLGILSDRLRKVDITTETLFGSIALIALISELNIFLRWPIPSYLCWAMIALMGSSSVLSHTITASYFPKEASARANTLLHLFHLGAAFVVQLAAGAVIDLWQVRDGVHPAQAYQIAFAVCLAIQATAMIWFVLPGIGRFSVQSSTRAALWQAFSPQASISPYREARREWNCQLAAARAHRDSWWCAALGSCALLVVFTSLVVHGR